jgi:hypothetical protein
MRSCGVAPPIQQLHRLARTALCPPPGHLCLLRLPLLADHALQRHSVTGSVSSTAYSACIGSCPTGRTRWLALHRSCRLGAASDYLHTSICIPARQLPALPTSTPLTSRSNLKGLAPKLISTHSFLLCSRQAGTVNQLSTWGMRARGHVVPAGSGYMRSAASAGSSMLLVAAGWS